MKDNKLNDLNNFDVGLSQEYRDELNIHFYRKRLREEDAEYALWFQNQ